MMAPKGSSDSQPPAMTLGGMMDYYANGGRGSTADVLKFLGQEDMLGNFYNLAIFGASGGGSGKSHTTIGDMMRGLGVNPSESIGYYKDVIRALNLRQQIINAKLKPDSKAKFEDWTKLVDKVPELLNLYSQARTVFMPVSGEGEELYYLGQQDPPFSNKVKINTDKMGDILNYAFTIGHEMLHVFDDKYNYSRFINFIFNG
ncbi:hypothetical protein GCM10023210_03700 [Chryseobacterium ginsengisoli]|uniref:Uncharacterized protein n=1 Tax=Chryseobacterium ginsengisoli TaxID=363853 RepID=A0ABP9LUS2_9FLAO